MIPCAHCILARLYSACVQMFGRRLAVFWAVVVAAVLTIFHVYINNYHNIISSETPDASSNGSSTSDPSSNGSSTSDLSSSCPGSPDPLMIVIMAITACYLAFQITLAFMKGVTFAPRPIDEAIHHPGACATRLALLQQTCPLWDYQRRIQEVKTKKSSQAVADGLDASLQPFNVLPPGSSAFAETDYQTAEGVGNTGAIPSFVKLLNVSPPQTPLSPLPPVCHAPLQSQMQMGSLWSLGSLCAKVLYVIVLIC